MSVPKIILELVERFELHREAYLAGKYNEAQLRQEFINPFFKALGWDIDNRFYLLVYELYGLTEAEIAIVEETTK